MQLIKKSNTTPGTRHGISLKKSLLIKSINPLKFLKLKYYIANERSRLTGHLTAWRRGDGCKKVFTQINLTNYPTKTVIIGVYYSNNRNSFITLFIKVIKRLKYYAFKF